MGNKGACICIITSRHISYNPRVLKEADALHEAGYTVQVIAVAQIQSRVQVDERLMAERNWTLTMVNAECSDLHSAARWLGATIRQRVSRMFYSLFPESMRDPAYSRYFYEIASRAVAVPADLYIAHNPQALPVASRAAQRHDALFGFDAEDFHPGEFPEEESSLQKTLTEEVEERYLPACDHCTAASEGIAEAYAETIGIQAPDVILNVFPLAEREGQTPIEELEQEQPPGGKISLYWYSQVIGPDRGLQDVLRALPQLDEHVHLALRGRWADGFEEQFRGLARELGVEHRLRVLPPVPPEQLVERATQHDIGLALEPGKDLNNDLAVSNKTFVYVLAGLPIVATDTTGQRQICEDIPAATRLCSTGDPEALGESIHSLLSEKGSLERAAAAAQKAGEERYNWGYEKKKLLESVERTFSVSPGAQPEEQNVATQVHSGGSSR